MKPKTISMLAASLFLFSCGNIAEEKSNAQTEINSMEEHHHDETETIELNNGEKWLVDENMMLHIRNMEKDIVENSSVEHIDYRILAEKLQKNIELLTSNCTMKGQAHDELHKWLLPFIDLVDGLSEASDNIEAAKQFQEIQASFTIFNQYFQ